MRQIGITPLWTLVVWSIPSLALAQPVLETLQPNRLNFGPIYVGAIAEGSARILLKGERPDGLEVRTRAAPFVQVRQTIVGSQRYGDLGTYLFCDVFVSINSGRAGKLSDTMEVMVGETRVSVPVACNVLEPQGDLTNVVVVQTPFNRFSTSDASAFDPWLHLVESAKLNVSYLEADRDRPVLQNVDLASADVVLLAGEGVIYLRESDIIKLKKFAYRGGRLILTANAFFRPTVEKTNELVSHYGLRMEDADSNLIDVDRTGITQHPLTAGVQSLRFHRASPISVEDKDRAELLVVSPSDPAAGFLALARSGQGELVVLGESLWWSWISSQLTAGADNLVLFKNLLVVR